MNGTIFGIGPLEIILVAVLILIVLGPERVPSLMRDLGRMTRSLRKYYIAFSSELKREIEPFRDDIKGIKDAAAGLRDDLGAIAQAADIRSIINATDLDSTATSEQTIAPPTVSTTATDIVSAAAPTAPSATGSAQPVMTAAAPVSPGSAATTAAFKPSITPSIVRFDVPIELEEDSPWLQAFQPPRADRLDDDNPWAA